MKTLEELVAIKQQRLDDNLAALERQIVIAIEEHPKNLDLIRQAHECATLLGIDVPADSLAQSYLLVGWVWVEQKDLPRIRRVLGCPLKCDYKRAQGPKKIMATLKCARFPTICLAYETTIKSGPCHIERVENVDYQLVCTR